MLSVQFIYISWQEQTFDKQDFSSIAGITDSYLGFNQGPSEALATVYLT